MVGLSGPVTSGFGDRLQLDLIACALAWACASDSCEVFRVRA